MKKFFALAIVVCMFAVANVFAENNASVNCSVTVLNTLAVAQHGTVDPIIVADDGTAGKLGTNVEMGWTISGSDYTVNYTYASGWDKPTPPTLTFDVALASGQVLLSSGSAVITHNITGVTALNVAPGPYVYTETITATGYAL